MTVRLRRAESSSTLKIESPGCIESNATLAGRIANHETGAFDVLVDRYHQFVFRICFRILGHRQDAEDATQDTFSRVAKYLHRWDRQRPFEPWLASVAGNRSRTHLARRRNHQPLTVAAEPHTHSTLQDHAADAMREEIMLALNNLSGRQRQAFLCFHEQSMSYAEISDHLGCPIGTVKTLVHRARASLIEQLRQREVIGDSVRRMKSASAGDSK